MINLSDLKIFYQHLSDDKINLAEKLKIIKKIENWVPIKDYIIVSNIGKVLFKCSKLPGELGIRSSSIVNKWKNLLLDNNKVNSKNDPHNNQSRSNINGNGLSNSMKSKNISRKSQPEIAPPKKVCLSLKDYYKRNGIERSETINNPSSDNEDDSGLTSESGIGFMDSFAVKPTIPVKPNKRKLLKCSEISSLTSATNINKRYDIVKENESQLDDDVTRRVDTNFKFWTPKVQKHYYSGDKQPKSLVNICQDILLTYRTCIEEVYMCPRELLITVLENYTPDQLLNFESFNPHHIEDNDGLWEKHLLTKYPDRTRIAHETWRQAFCRTVKQEETRFQLSVQNMKMKLEENFKNTQKNAIKMIPVARRNPVKQNFFHNSVSNSPYSRVTQKLQRQYKKQFSHLKF